MHREKVSAVHTSPLCVRVWVCLHTCVAVLIKCSCRVTRAPSPLVPSPGPMNGISSIIVGSSSGAQTQIGCVFFGVEGIRGKGGGHVEVVFSTPGRGQGSSPFWIHLSASSGAVGPGLMKTSGFWQLRSGSVCARWFRPAPRAKARGAGRAPGPQGPRWSKKRGDCLLLGSLSLLTGIPPRPKLELVGGGAELSLLIWCYCLASRTARWVEYWPREAKLS